MLHISGWQRESRVPGLPKQSPAEKLPGAQQGREQLRRGPLHRLHQELAAAGDPDGQEPRGRDARQLLLLSCCHWETSGTGGLSISNYHL